MKEKNEVRSGRPGGSISVTQPSRGCSEFELRAGERSVGSLRWRRGRRSIAQAEGVGVGSLELMARRRHVVVTGDERAGRLATLEREGRGWVINLAQGPAFHWRRVRSDRWTVSSGDTLALSLSASQGVLTSSLLISIERAEHEETVILLCLIGAFLALRELRTVIDAGAAIGGIVAAGSG